MANAGAAGRGAGPTPVGMAPMGRHHGKKLMKDIKKGGRRKARGRG